MTGLLPMVTIHKAPSQHSELRRILSESIINVVLVVRWRPRWRGGNGDDNGCGEDDGCCADGCAEDDGVGDVDNVGNGERDAIFDTMS